MKNTTLKRVLVIIMVVVMLAGLGLTAFAALKVGDLDGDGRVTAFDAQMWAEYRANKRALTDEQKEAAGDMEVSDMIDVVLSENYEPTGPIAAQMKTMAPEPVFTGKATDVSYYDAGMSKVTINDAAKSITINQKGTTQKPIGLEFYKGGKVINSSAWAISMDVALEIDPDKTVVSSMTFLATEDKNNGVGFKFLKDMDTPNNNAVKRYIHRDGTRLQKSGDEFVIRLTEESTWNSKLVMMFCDDVIYLFMDCLTGQMELITSYPVDYEKCIPQLEVLQHVNVELTNYNAITNYNAVKELHDQLLIPEDCKGEAKVLFLGNSCLFYYDVPNTFARLAKNAGYYVQVNAVCRSSARIDMFVNESDYLYTLSQAEMARWDYDSVVFQGLSTDTNTQSNMQRAIEASRELVPVIEATGAEAYMFVRPARMLRDMDGDGTRETFVVYTDGKGYEDLYGGIAVENDIRACYVNRAFSLAYQEDNNVDLWHTDDAHSNPRGCYLSACVMFASYFNTSCENVGDNGLPAEDAAFLRQIADRVVLEGEMPNW